MSGFAEKPMTFTAARDWLEQKVTLPTGLNSAEIANELPGAIRMQSFFSAKVASASILENFRSQVQDIADGRLGYAEGRKRMTEFLASQGVGIPAPGTDEDKSVKTLGSTARLELILRQNVAMAHAIGQREVSEHPAIMELYPNYKYMAVMDEATRDSHAELDGLVLPKDDPFWDTHFPPWEYNCRCMAIDTDEEVTGKATGFRVQGSGGKKEEMETGRQGDDEAQTGVVQNGARTLNLLPNRSGFVFRSNPKEAFGEPDFERIKDPEIRSMVKSEFEKKAAVMGIGARSQKPESRITGLDRARNGMRVGGSGAPLDDAEKNAIHDWSSPMFEDMRNVELGRPVKRVTADEAAAANARIESAMKKLPGFIGTTYRGVSLASPQGRDEYLGALRPGMEVTWPARSSSSKSDAIALKYAHGDGVDRAVIFVVNGKTGRDIHHWTRKNEQEVLFPNNTALRVDKIEGNRIFVSEV